ncbi:NAD(P)/FAD-dependent oxidoreductase [Thermodesulforhabdus norvegica]|uniref:Dehydrogenase (Flavoprotein) n=1 Tax=Thermodesulforhabdus norvegica TaxID=39841 RepID=A0A1I4TWE0_9BACT|nr:NAD(P)/FAD-dependent oxidoreductase [Thermodesulforhabdus norvegica]SFM81106.1 Dehydrogenase (flavoprotein) [Thermodesulforhabdus norvegica]
MAAGICVVGGSVAGLFAAKMLAMKGFPVDLYDSGDLLEPAGRTLIVTSDFLKTPDCGFSFIIRNYIHSFQLISPNNSVNIPLREPDLVVNRADLVKYLLKEARQAGVRIYVSHRLITAVRTAGGISLQFSDGENEKSVCYGKVIGADGVYSTLARTFGCNGYKKVALLQFPVKLPRDQPSHVTRVWFDRDITPFFVWLIPETPLTGVVGIIAPTMAEARRGLEKFLGGAGLSQEGPPQLGEVPLPPIYPVPPLSWNPRDVFFVGDAAAQVKATTVGGVVTGIKGAIAACKAIVTGRNYRLIALPLWRELLIHSVIQRLLEQCGNEDYDFMLTSLNKYGLRVLSKYPRDRLFQILPLIASSQPNWIILACRLLIKASGISGIKPLLPSVSQERKQYS